MKPAVYINRKVVREQRQAKQAEAKRLENKRLHVLRSILVAVNLMLDCVSEHREPEPDDLQLLIDAVGVLIEPPELVPFKQPIFFGGTKKGNTQNAVQLHAQINKLCSLISGSQQPPMSTFSEGVSTRWVEASKAMAREAVALKKSIVTALDLNNEGVDKLDDRELVRDAQLKFKPVPASIHGRAKLEWYPIVPGSIVGQLERNDGLKRSFKDNGKGKLVFRGGATCGTVNYKTGEVRVVKSCPSGYFNYVLDYEIA